MTKNSNTENKSIGLNEEFLKRLSAVEESKKGEEERKKDALTLEDLSKLGAKATRDVRVSFERVEVIVNGIAEEHEAVRFKIAHKGHDIVQKA